MDVNKIIMESLQDVIGEPLEKKVEEVSDPKATEETVVAEEAKEKEVSAADKKEEAKEETKPEEKKEPEDKKEDSGTSPAKASAMAAGLGAVTLRKTLAKVAKKSK